MYKIDKGITVPNWGKKCKYPFDRMEVGDSFVVPRDLIEPVRVSAIKYGKRHGIKFITRKVSDKSIRLWRII